MFPGYVRIASTDETSADGTGESVEFGDTSGAEEGVGPGSALDVAVEVELAAGVVVGLVAVGSTDGEARAQLMTSTLTSIAVVIGRTKRTKRTTLLPPGGATPPSGA